MKCDKCDREATVHELRVVSGKKVEKHLCEECAKQQGIAVSGQMPISQLLSKYILTPETSGKVAGKALASRAPACERCSTTYAEFRQSGLLGCPDCYKAFEPQLGPLLERAHEGGTHHVGKIPRRALRKSQDAPKGGVESVLGTAEERAERLLSLRRQLDEAIRAEHYERAAKLRDELRNLIDIDPLTKAGRLAVSPGAAADAAPQAKAPTSPSEGKPPRKRRGDAQA